MHKYFLNSRISKYKKLMLNMELSLEKFENSLKTE